jgi:hypothetical protein
MRDRASSPPHENRLSLTAGLVLDVCDRRRVDHDVGATDSVNGDVQAEGNARRRGAFTAGVHSGRAQVSAAEEGDRPAVGLDRQILRTLEVAVAGRVRWQRKDRELGAVEREDGCIVIVRGRGSQKPDRGLSMRTRRLTELVQDSSLLPLPRPPITVLSRGRVLVQRSESHAAPFGIPTVEATLFVR